MNTASVKYLFFLILFGLFAQSCSDDTTVPELESSTAETAGQFAPNDNGRPDNNGGNNNGNRGDNRRGNANQEVQVITEWTDLFLRVERYAEGMRPNATARALAYIHLAAYETYVPADNSLISNSTKLDGLSEIEAPTGTISYPIALNEAYKATLDHFLINVPADQDAQITNKYDQLSDRLARETATESILASQAWGAKVAEAIIAYAATDRQGEAQILDAQPSSYVPPTGEGYWTFSAEPERALFPYWGQVRTFVISPDQTSTVAPFQYSTDTDSPYYQQMMEVYNANNSARDNSDEQLWIAEFWSDDVTGITFSPPARQYSISNQLIQQYRMDAGQALLLNVKLGFALNDAAVSTWKYKYDHMVMRPSVYIQEFIDPEYQTNLYRLIPWPNPTFPAYPSGHSTFASAAAGVFIATFGDRTNFTDRSHAGRREFESRPRSYRSFRDMAKENAFSRIPLGVHMDMDCAEGLRLGYEISDAINSYDLTTL